MERRRHDRHRLWIPIEIIGDGADAADGVVHDVSEHGVLAVTNASFALGARVTVRLQMPDSAERKLVGVIARVGDNSEDPDSLWRREIAVHFDDAIPDVDALLRLGEKLP